MRRAGSALGGLVVVAACAAQPGSGSTDNTNDDTAGMGVPQQSASGAVPGERRALRAGVHLAPNGCFLGSLPGAGRARYLVVWPAGTEQGSSGVELQLPDGTAVRDGDRLVGAGLVAPTRDLEGFGEDGYWDFAVGFCTPRATEVLVLDSAAVR